MNIEIFGAKFINKGAELMLNAAIEQIRLYHPDANIVLSCNNKEQWNTLTEKGFSKRLNYRKYILDFGDIGRFIPRFIRKKHSIILNSEIDLVLEASGFAYGDQWTYRLALFMSRYLQSLKKNGAKVIILPQAMGPFNNPLNAKYTAEFLENADRVYIRDSVSLEYVKQLQLKNPNVKQKPDFTILLRGKEDARYNKYKDYVCIIPNNKVISTSKDANIEIQYLNFFRKVIEYNIRSGQKVFILNHEGQKDYDLALKINNGFDEVDIVWEKDPLIIKYIIGNSLAVIGSRFHGLVSSLSQGVPSLAIGWSHKYEMLFQDFGFSKGVLRLDLEEAQIEAKLDQLLEKNERAEIIKSINNHGNQLKAEAKQMWQEIFKEERSF